MGVCLAVRWLSPFKFSLARQLTIIKVPDSLASSASHELHRRRRAAMQRFFSKSSIRRLEPAIQDSLKTLLYRLEASGRQHHVLSMNFLCKAATCDIISEYAFGASTEYLHQDDLNVGFFKSLEANFRTSWYMAYFPWVGPMLQRVPPSVMGIVYPGLKSLRLMHEVRFRGSLVLGEMLTMTSNGWSVLKRFAGKSTSTVIRMPVFSTAFSPAPSHQKRSLPGGCDKRHRYLYKQDRIQLVRSLCRV